jgi:hypothetical protein
MQPPPPFRAATSHNLQINPGRTEEFHRVAFRRLPRRLLRFAGSPSRSWEGQPVIAIMQIPARSAQFFKSEVFDRGVLVQRLGVRA